jgi:molybdopterin converting factor small subunit
LGLRVEVAFKGPISLVTGEKIGLELEEGAKVKDLIAELNRCFLGKARERRLEEVILNLESKNLILIEEREISALEGVETPLKEGNKILLLNFTHGG